MTEAGALPYLAQIAKGALAQPSEPGSAEALRQGGHSCLLASLICTLSAIAHVLKSVCPCREVVVWAGLYAGSRNMKSCTSLTHVLLCIAGKMAEEAADDGPPKATVMAQKALKLLYSLASYFAGHAALQADGCLEVLVSAMATSDAISTQYAVWAVQSLTGRGLRLCSCHGKVRAAHPSSTT